VWSSGKSCWLQNGDVLCFVWDTKLIFICYVEESRPPLWSSVHSSWLQILRSRFDSRRYQIFWEVVGLERGPLSLVSTTEEELGRKIWGSGLESREYGRRNLSRWQCGTLYPQKYLVLTSPISGGCTITIVRSRTEATEFSFFYCTFSVCIQYGQGVLNKKKLTWFKVNNPYHVNQPFVILYSSIKTCFREVRSKLFRVIHISSPLIADKKFLVNNFLLQVQGVWNEREISNVQVIVV
jgi:hypothetical protein